MFPAAHSFFGVVTHTYLASTSSGLNVVATSRPNIGLKVATLRPMFRFGKVTHTYLASKSPGLNVAWPQRRLASMSPGLNVAWPQCRGLNVAGLNVAWPQCPIVFYTGGWPKWLLRELFHGKQGGQGQRPSVVGIGLICWHVLYSGETLCHDNCQLIGMPFFHTRSTGKNNRN